jgi:guanylate kinase
MSNRRGHLFILSGPAGAGKGTLRKQLFERVSGLVYSVSCTTRTIRSGEVEARDYYFVDKEEFGRLIIKGEFLEWAEVHGNYYGTRRADVETCLDLGCDMVLEIDVQGARQIKEKMPGAVSIFITVRSLDELEARLEGRGTESPDQLLLRLRNAAVELRYAKEYDHVVVNDDLDRATDELVALVEGNRKER